MGKACLWVALGLVACSGSGADSSGSGGSGALGGGSAHGGALNGGDSSAGSGAGGTSSASAGTSSGAGTSNAAGSSSAGASNTFTATPVSAPSQMRGEVTLAQYSADASSFETNVDIYFTYDRGQWDGCTRYQLGNCGYYDCPAGSNPIGSPENARPFTMTAGLPR